jgi:inosine-uridine nucleoside N-ribohydrolase
MAFAMHAAGEIRLVAVFGDDNIGSAQMADAFNQYWGTNVPIGMSRSGVWHSESSIQWNVLQHYHRRWEFPAADELLAEVLWQNPGQVRLVSVGYPNVFAQLLWDRPVAAQRAHSLTLMGGDFWMAPYQGGQFWDVNNFKNDPFATDEVIRNWPGTVQFVGQESGHTLIAGEYEWRTAWNNPLHLAIDAHGWTGRLHRYPQINSPDPVALLFAVYPDGFAGAHRTENFSLGYSPWENRGWVEPGAGRAAAVRITNPYQVRVLIESWLYRQP